MLQQLRKLLFYQIMDTKLLFKQKQFQSQSNKRRIQIKPCTSGNPLIRDRKSPSRPIAPPEITANINNPLMRMKAAQKPLPAPEPPARRPQVVEKKPQIKEDVKKSDKGQWSSIRGDFLKGFDTRKQRLDIMVANPFGNSGLKRDEEVKAQSTREPGREIGRQNEAGKATQISIRTYLFMLEEIRKQMRKNWQAQDKVATLQKAIQATKLLHDAEKTKFHALKFAYVIDIVEQFGIYVYERIKSLSFPSYSQQRLKQTTLQQLQGSNISENAQQICRNWLQKIGSIRQLMPRALIETTLLRIYFFLEGGKYVKPVLYRLAKTNRGFGQYINAIFFSTFLIRIGHECLPKQKGFILDIMDDVFFYIKQGKTKFSRNDVSYDQFLQVLEPFFKSAFQSLGQSLNQSDFRRFSRSLPPNPHPIILKNLINCFSPELMAICSVDLSRMLQKVYAADFKYPLYKMMLSKLANLVFPQSKQLIYLAWVDFTEITDIKNFLQLLAPLVQIVFRNMSGISKTQTFGLIVDKFNSLLTNFSNPKEKQFFHQYEVFLATLLQNTQQQSQVLTIQPFLQIVNYFPKAVRTQIACKTSQQYLARQQPINDPMIVNTLLTLMKNIEGQQAARQLVLKFINKVDFDKDFEGILNFYASVRAVFGSIQQITTTLIHKALKLTLTVRKLTKSKYSKKLTAFMQACIAFCFITAPLIENSISRIQIYLHIGQVALSHNLISQCSSLVKTAIKQLTELQLEPKEDQVISDLLTQIVGFLIVVPDDPQNQFLFMFNGLLSAFETIKFKSNFQTYKIKFYSDTLVYLNSQMQQRLPFHIQGVNSNDYLFKTKDFRKAVMQKLLQVFTKLEQSVWVIQKNTLQNIQFDRHLATTTVHCFVNIISNLHFTVRTEAFLTKLSEIFNKTCQRLVKDKTSKNLLNQYQPALQHINKKLREQQYRSVALKTF